MRLIVVMFALIGTMTAGCFQVAPQPPLPPTTMSSSGSPAASRFRPDRQLAPVMRRSRPDTPRLRSMLHGHRQHRDVHRHLDRQRRSMQSGRRLPYGFRQWQRHDLIRPAQIVSGRGQQSPVHVSSSD